MLHTVSYQTIIYLYSLQLKRIKQKEESKKNFKKLNKYFISEILICFFLYILNVNWIDTSNALCFANVFR